MPLFDVRFEDVAFLADAENNDIELSEQELLGFTETCLKEGTFPEGVVGVVKAYITPDDSVYEDGVDEEGDCKVFCSITLRVEAEDADEAAYMDPPEDLLTKIADMISTDLDLERDWENVDYDPAETNEPTPA